MANDYGADAFVSIHQNSAEANICKWYRDIL